MNNGLESLMLNIFINSNTFSRKLWCIVVIVTRWNYITMKINKRVMVFL